MHSPFSALSGYTTPLRFQHSKWSITRIEVSITLRVFSVFAFLLLSSGILASQANAQNKEKKSSIANIGTASIAVLASHVNSTLTKIWTEVPASTSWIDSYPPMPGPIPDYDRVDPWDKYPGTSEAEKKRNWKSDLQKNHPRKYQALLKKEAEKLKLRLKEEADEKARSIYWSGIRRVQLLLTLWAAKDISANRLKRAEHLLQAAELMMLQRFRGYKAVLLLMASLQLKKIGQMGRRPAELLILITRKHYLKPRRPDGPPLPPPPK